MAQDIIELRTGQFSALFISINSSSLTAIKRALAKKSKTSPSLFKNIEVILQFNPMLEKVNLIALRDLLAEYQIRLIGVADWQNHLQRELILAANLSILGNVNNLSEILPRIIRTCHGRCQQQFRCDLYTIFRCGIYRRQQPFSL